MTSPATSNTAWSYLVVSSEQQAETLEHQAQWAQQTAASHDWRITDSFRGVSSGRDGTRDLLERLLERLRSLPPEQRPARVLMIRLDRIGRGLALEALAAIAEVARLGIVIHTRQDGDYTLERASDSILPLMRVITGAIENEARRDKAKAVFARRRARGLVVSNKRPYGLRLEDQRDVAQEPQAEAVRLAFELALNGYGFVSIGSRLRAVAPPKTYVNGRSHRTEWTATRVRKLLRQPAYCGILVDEERWHQVQMLHSGRPSTRERTKHPWPLAGTLHCTCGRMLIGSLHGSVPRRIYRCTATMVHGHNVMHNANKLEEAFVALLERLKAAPDLIALYLSSCDAALSETALNTREAELGTEMDRQKTERARAWQLNERGLIVDVELARRLREVDVTLASLQRDREGVAQELARLARSRDEQLRVDQILKEAAAAWPHASLELRRPAAQALARALGGLYVDDAGHLELGAPPHVERFLRAHSERGS